MPGSTVVDVDSDSVGCGPGVDDGDGLRDCGLFGVAASEPTAGLSVGMVSVSGREAPTVGLCAV